MSRHRDQLRSEARKAAYKDTWSDNFNPGQFSDLRQQQWYAEKYDFIISKQGEWRNV